MSKFSKIISLMLALTLVFGFAACKGGSGGSNTATLNAIAQVLSGAIKVGGDSRLTLRLTKGSSFTGSIDGSDASGSHHHTALLDTFCDTMKERRLTSAGLPCKEDRHICRGNILFCKF